MDLLVLSSFGLPLISIANGLTFVEYVKGNLWIVNSIDGCHSDGTTCSCNCNDNNPCTDDTCDMLTGGCKYTAKTCPDASKCSLGKWNFVEFSHNIRKLCLKWNMHIE